jgi:hypothetical protein
MPEARASHLSGIEPNDLSPCAKCGRPALDSTRAFEQGPLCGRCVCHFELHRTFDSRCAICWIERKQARIEYLRIFELAHDNSSMKNGAAK